MLNFKPYFSVDRLAIVLRGKPIEAASAQQHAAAREFVLGVNKKTLASMFGTIYAFDVVTGQCVIQKAGSTDVEAFDEAFDIPATLAPDVLYRRGDEWSSGKLLGLGEAPKTFVIMRDDFFKTTVPEKDLCFPGQMAIVADYDLAVAGQEPLNSLNERNIPRAPEEEASK